MQWLRRIKPIHGFILFILIVLAAIPLTPTLIGVVIKHAAENQGFHVSYSKADLSPMKGKLEYWQLEISTNEQTLFQCEHCMVRFDVGEAFAERYVIREAELASARFFYAALPKGLGEPPTAIPYWQIERLSAEQFELTGLPKLEKKKTTIHKLEIENLSSNSTQAGIIRSDIGINQARLNLTANIVTSPAIDFETIDLSLKNFNPDLIPDEYQPESTDIAGIIDARAKLHWANNEKKRRKLRIKDLSVRIGDAAVTQAGNKIHSVNSQLNGSGEIAFGQDYIPDKITYKGKASFSGVMQNETSGDSNIMIENTLLDFQTGIELTEDLTNIQTSGSLDAPSLGFNLSEGLDINGSLSWDGKAQVQIASGERAPVNVLEGTLTTSLNIKTGSTQTSPLIALRQLSFTGSGSLSGDTPETQLIEIKGDTKSETVEISQLPGNPELKIQLESPDIRQFALNLSPLTIHLDSAVADKVTLAGGSTEGILPISGISLDTLDYQPEKLKIKTASLDHIAIDVQKNSEGKYSLNPDALLASTETDQAISDEDKSASTSIIIDSITIGKNSTVTFSDYSVEPEFKTRLVMNSATVNQLSINGQQPTTFQAEGTLGERGTFVLEGDLLNGAETTDVEVASKLTGLSLDQYSQYTGELIGYKMDKGYMDLEIDTSIKERKLGGNTKLLITGLDVSSLKNETQKTFDKSLGLALPSAISMLEDKKGHIDLNVPIGGDIDNPDFGLGDVISKALGKGLKSGLLLSLQPLGLAVLAVDAIASLGGIPLGEVNFETGSAVINSVAAERLKLVAEKMKEKPGMSLKACAVALENELPPGSIKKKTKEGQTQGEAKQATAAPIDPEFTKKLVTDRRQAVHDFILEQKIDESRFVECEPQVIKADGNKPAVMLIVTDSATDDSAAPPEDKKDKPDQS
jgi:hypothetical protein